MNVGFRIPSRVDTEPVERTFDLRQYLNFVWRHWMFIASVTALAFLIAVIYLARATPLYTATTQVLLERPEKAPDRIPFDRLRQLRRFFVHREPAGNHPIRPAAAKGRGQGAACSAAHRLRRNRRVQNLQRNPTAAEDQSILDGDQQPAGRISGVAERRSPGAQYFHHLDGSGSRRAARQRGGRRLCC